MRGPGNRKLHKKILTHDNLPIWGKAGVAGLDRKPPRRKVGTELNTRYNQGIKTIWGGKEVPSVRPGRPGDAWNHN